MTTKTAYNEQVKLSASLINLMAAGVMTVGLITPLVGTRYGSHINIEVGSTSIVVAIVYLLVLAWGLRGLALLTLRSLIK